MLPTWTCTACLHSSCPHRNFKEKKATHSGSLVFAQIKDIFHGTSSTAGSHDAAATGTKMRSPARTSTGVSSAIDQVVRTAREWVEAGKFVEVLLDAPVEA